MINAKYQSGTNFCIEIFDSTSRTCMTVADAVRLKEELTKAIDDAEKDKKEELTEWQRFISGCLQKHGLLDCGAADRIAKESVSELLALAKKQLDIEILKDRAIELTKHLNESGLDENSIEYELIEFMCNLIDCPNWSEIVETAGLYAGRIKAEAVKNLPRWKKAKKHMELSPYEFVFTLDNDGKFSPYWDTEVEEGQFYITESDIKNLPKEGEK